MISLDVFKGNVGVSSDRYVKEWIAQDLIPDVIVGPDIKSTLFPNSARRPYKERSKIKPASNADALRAHIVKAALSQQHITYQMCHICADEFDGYINELAEANLIRIRVTDGIKYYDSTLLSGPYKNRKIHEIRKFIIDALAAVSKGIAEGTATAILDAAS